MNFLALTEFRGESSVSPLSRLFVCQSWVRDSGGVQSTGVSQSVRETGRDESQGVRSQVSLKQGIWSSHFLRDLSQLVGRTPWDTPVPLYTRTSPWPNKANSSQNSPSSSQNSPSSQSLDLPLPHGLAPSETMV